MYNKEDTEGEALEPEEDLQDWDLDERDKWLEESDDNEDDPTEVAVEADE